MLRLAGALGHDFPLQRASIHHLGEVRLLHVRAELVRGHQDVSLPVTGDHHHGGRGGGQDGCGEPEHPAEAPLPALGSADWLAWTPGTVLTFSWNGLSGASRAVCANCFPWPAWPFGHVRTHGRGMRSHVRTRRQT